MHVARPKIFEPTIRLYDRPVHPEFFRIVAEKTIRRKEYEVSLAITSAGHLIHWTDGGRTLVEVVNAAIRELPRSALVSRSLSDPSKDPLTLPNDDVYRHSSRFEEVSPEFFDAFAKEFSRNPESNGLMFRFDFSGRLTLGGISYIGVAARARELKVRAVHTFPDDAALLKTETVFRVRRDG